MYDFRLRLHFHYLFNATIDKTMDVAAVFFVLLLTLPKIIESQKAPNDDFFLMCSGGEVEKLKTNIEEHPEWINAVTENGESCLHLAGIQGFAAVTELLLEKGANPDIRTTFAQGLRMHPLSWNVYGGHVENVRLLSEHGAAINADFDSMQKNVGPVTSLDIALELVKNEPGDDRFPQIVQLLRKHGGKTMKDLVAEKNEEL